MNKPLMTQAEYAAHRGVRPSAVSNWKKAELLVFAEDVDRPGKLFVDVMRSDARINARIDPARGAPRSGVAAPAMPGPLGAAVGTAAPAPVNDLNNARFAQVRAQTDGMLLKNAQLAGELGPIVELQRRAVAIGSIVRERMHAMTRELAERLAAETEIRAIVALQGEAIDEVFRELADMIEGGALADEDDDGDDAPIENDEAAEAETG